MPGISCIYARIYEFAMDRVPVIAFINARSAESTTSIIPIAVHRMMRLRRNGTIPVFLLLQLII